MNFVFGFFFLCASGITYGVNSARLVLDASGKVQEKEGATAIMQCLNLLNLSDDNANSTYERLWRSIPSYRYLGLCPRNASMVGMLVEMKAHLSFIYAANDDKLTCQIVGLAPPTTVASGFLAATPRNASRPTQIEEVKEKHERNYTSTVVVSEINMTYCNDRTRTMGIHLDFASDNVPRLLKLTWNRKPEHYEDGEIGWSSVGAQQGALSGTFSLTGIQLTYSPSILSDCKLPFRKTDLTAIGENMDRFRARAGDFYQCASSRHILLTTLLPSDAEEGLLNRSVYLNVTNNIFVVLTTRDIRLQSFSDFNQNSFTGAGVTCEEDAHEDHTVAIGIGSAVCIILVISFIGIALTRLNDRDKELQSHEEEYRKMTNRSSPDLKAVSNPHHEMKVIRNKQTPV